MFRLQENVPSNYIDESRDFQLFIRLLDCIQGGVKFDIDTMQYLLDPMKVNNRMLKLLCSRVGFFPKRDLNSNMLRNILAAFPYIIKYKGSVRGIKEAIATVLKADNIYSNYSVNIVNKNASGEQYVIEIVVEQQYDEIALRELLDYILPLGYTMKLLTADTKLFTTELDLVNVIQTYIDPAVSVSQIISNMANDRMPTYSIVRTPANIEEQPTLSVETSLDDESLSIITYTYYSMIDDVLTKNVVEVNVYTDNHDREIGSIDRSEIIGRWNDLSHSVSKDTITGDGKNLIDKELKSDLLFNDQGEQSTVENILYSLYENSGIVFKQSGETEIPINIINAPRGTVFTEGMFLIDSIGSLGEITRVTANSVFVTTTVYAGDDE